MSYQTWRTFFGRGRPGGVRMSIKDWPERERPREKLLASGAQALSDAELLAVLLGSSGRRGVDAVAMARNLLGRHQSLRALLSAAPGVCLAAPGIGAAGYCRLQAALELARRHYAEALRAGPPLHSPAATREFLVSRLREIGRASCRESVSISVGA